VAPEISLPFSQKWAVITVLSKWGTASDGTDLQFVLVAAVKECTSNLMCTI
jgi:hypothetical protein